MPDLKFHHIGCIVKNIRDAIEGYRPLTSKMGEIIHVSTQGVNICLLELGTRAFLELVEPTETTSALHGLAKKGISYYHLGFTTPNFDQTVASLIREGHRHLSTFCSEAFQMRRCAFLVSSIGHLIEIVETD